MSDERPRRWMRLALAAVLATALAVGGWFAYQWSWLHDRHAALDAMRQDMNHAVSFVNVTAKPAGDGGAAAIELSPGLFTDAVTGSELQPSFFPVDTWNAIFAQLGVAGRADEPVLAPWPLRLWGEPGIEVFVLQADDADGKTKARLQRLFPEGQVVTFDKNAAGDNEAEDESPQELKARSEKTVQQLKLAERLHDEGRDREAAAAMEVVVKAVGDGGDQEMVLRRLGSDQRQARARMNWFRANAAAAAGDRGQQLACLDSAIIDAPMDVDVLISLYHLPDQDPGRHEYTLGLIGEALEFFDRMVQEHQIVEYCNQLSWLISHTEGDWDQAIQCAHQAVDAERSAGHLDTLAYAFFARSRANKAQGAKQKARDDLKAAVKYQTAAAEAEPKLREIANRLEAFKAELNADAGDQPVGE